MRLHVYEMCMKSKRRGNSVVMIDLIDSIWVLLQGEIIYRGARSLWSRTTQQIGVFSIETSRKGGTAGLDV